MHTALARLLPIVHLHLDTTLADTDQPRLLVTAADSPERPKQTCGAIPLISSLELPHVVKSGPYAEAFWPKNMNVM